MQRDKRLNVVLVALGEKVVVELDTLGVDFAGSVGEDAAPGNGEANAVDAKLLAQLQVDGVLVVEVGSGIGEKRPWASRKSSQATLPLP